MHRQCSWFDCSKESKWFHKRASSYFCDEHYEVNWKRFLKLGYNFKCEKIKEVKNA